MCSWLVSCSVLQEDSFSLRQLTSYPKHKVVLKCQSSCSMWENLLVHQKTMPPPPEHSHPEHFQPHCIFCGPPELPICIQQGWLHPSFCYPANGSYGNLDHPREHAIFSSHTPFPTGLTPSWLLHQLQSLWSWSTVCQACSVTDEPWHWQWHRDTSLKMAVLS